MYLLFLALGAFLLGGGVIVITNMLGERDSLDSNELELELEVEMDIPEQHKQLTYQDYQSPQT